MKNKFMFKCPKCQSLMTIETDIDQDKIHRYPPCPCGYDRMISLTSREYAYGAWE